MIMTEKEKMLRGELYDANYDKELIEERLRCKIECQKYIRYPIILKNVKIYWHLSWVHLEKSLPLNPLFGVIMVIIFI